MAKQLKPTCLPSSVAALTATTKQPLRVQAKQYRAQWSMAAKQTEESAIQQHLVAWVASNKPSTILGYWPLANELSITSCFNLWHQQGITIYLPVIASATPPAMQFYPWQPGISMHTNQYGIAEPSTINPPWQSQQMPALILVPALAVDNRGHRVGYGGGFYDAFLGGLPNHAGVQTMGVCADSCRVPTITDTAPHDVALKWVVSQAGVQRVSQ